MSIIISGIRADINKSEFDVIESALKKSNLSKYFANAYIYKRSIDCRRGDVKFVYSIALDLGKDESKIAQKLKNVQFKLINPTKPIEITGTREIENSPVIAGLGPAGLFCAYILSQNGYNPIVFERGTSIEDRDVHIEEFFNDGKFNENSNIQFGEGGAGTYSDGKLTTRIGDNKCEIVLKTLCEHGAGKEILTMAKPHIGTDILKKIVVSMRNQIIKNGGSIHFSHKLDGINQKGEKIHSITVNGNQVPCDALVLAIGHSARDTFFALHQNGLYFEPKPFSIGARIEHRQQDIDKSVYGKFFGHEKLPAAEYTLSHRQDDRACYSFCMCPGGVVVAASSEAGGVVTNGMSYSAREGQNANSAIVVSVDPADFDDGTPFGGIALQRQCESLAYSKYGKNYTAPVQTLKDFLDGVASKTLPSSITPSYPRGVKPCDIGEVLPKFVTNMMKIGLLSFERKLKGFTQNDAILTAPETRTSSPVRILRGQDLISIDIKGIIPCGEGAGYAGGIMSAAVDGIRAAERIMAEFKPY